MYLTSDLRNSLTAADDEASGAKAVIADTLHSVHADITKKLNFALLYPHLNQAGILPADSLPNFMCPMVPDHTTAQVDRPPEWVYGHPYLQTPSYM